MDAALRQVTRLPLEELWDEHGSFGRRLGFLTRNQLRAVVAQGPIRLVSANLGEPLRWTALADCNDRWKAVAAHIADPDGFRLDDFPDGFAYVASDWEGRLGERLVVLEVHH